MSLWDKIINQNKLDSSLIVELSDISYRSTKGKREQPRGLKEGIVDIGTMPFEETPPQTEITREMIKEYQKEQEKPYIEPGTGDKFKYDDVCAIRVNFQFHFQRVYPSKFHIKCISMQF